MFRRIVLIPAIVVVLSLLILSPVEAQSKEDAARLYKEANDLQQKARSNEDLKKAVQKYEEALQICQTLGDSKTSGYVYNSLAVVYSHWGQYQKAVEYYEKALEFKRKVGDLEGEGVTLNNLGVVYKNWGQYNKAAEHYEKGLVICRKLGDLECEIAPLNNLGIVYWHLGEQQKAVEFYEKSLAICRKLGDLKGEGRSLGNLGIVYSDWGQYQKAVGYCEKDLAICRKLGDLKGEGRSLNTLGTVYTAWGQYQKAVELCERSAEIARKLGDQQAEASALNSLGNVCLHRGQNKKAMEYYEKSLAIRRKTSDLNGVGRTLGNLGLVYENWGQYQKAVEYYEKSAEVARNLGDQKTEANALSYLGGMYSGWGQYEKAAEYYERSLVIKRNLGDLKGEGFSLSNLGEVYVAWGHYERALASFRQALAIQEKIGISSAWSKGQIARVYLDLGDFAKAEPLVKEANGNSTWGRFYLLKSDFLKAKECYEKILKAAEENRNAKSLFTAYSGLGAAYEGSKDDKSAAEYYEKAINHTEELRAGLAPAEREKFFDVRINGFFRTAPYEGLARVQMRQNKPQDAFKTTEYTRARVFAEAMTRMSAGKNLAVPSEIVKQDDSLNNELTSLKKNLQKAYEKNNKLVIQSLEPQVKEKEGKLQAHIKMLRGKYPLFAATKYPQPMDLSQTALKDNEWVLSYDMTDPGLIIYLTRGKALIKSLFKAVSRKAMDDLVRKFREPLEIKEATPIRNQLKKFDFTSGKKLSDILLSDILPVLPKDTPVIVAPGGSIGIVPFEMLVLNDGGKIATDKEKTQAIGAEFFGDRNPISYYQSVTALTLARTLGKHKGSGQKVLVMDDPVFGPDDPRMKQAAESKKQATLASLPDKLMSIKKEIGLTFPRLPLTGELGQSLKKLEPKTTDEFTGIQANKAVLFEKPLNQYSSMIFATHGYFGKDLPGIMEPVLVLTLPGQPQGMDGFLRLSEVMGLKLNADMVALTACQTGLGRRISGEGTMGMGRAFQYAGAKTVLMSLWSVSEQASVKLVESFFQNLKQGKNKLEALKIARDEIRKDGYDHPFYWAPFILVGEVN